MAGPGGAERGRISIRVLPDTSAFGRSLERYLLRVERSLRVEIPTVIDTKGLAVAARAAAKEAEVAAGKVKVPVEFDAKPALRNVGTVQRALTGALARIGKGTAVAALAVTVAAAVPHTLALAGALSQVAGVAVILPGLFAAVAAPLAAVVIGTRGFGAALKASGDPQKFAEAVKTLSPAARAAAVDLRALRPAFTDLRLAVQERLFTGLGTALTGLTRAVLPQVRAGLAAVAGAVNGSARDMIGALTRAGGSGIIAAILGDVAAAVSRFRSAIAPLTGAILQVTRVGTSFLPRLAQQAAAVAANFARFLSSAAQSGQLAAFLSAGLHALQQVGQVIVALTRTVTGLVAASSAAVGGGPLTGLVNILSAIATEINSAPAQAALVTVFSGINAGATALMGVLPVVASALGQLAPVIAQLATAAGQSIAPLFAAIAQAIAALGPGISQVIVGLQAGLGSLVPAIAPVGAALLALAPAIATLAGAAGPALASLLTSAASAAVALAPAIQVVADVIAALAPHATAAAAAVIGFNVAMKAAAVASKVQAAGGLLAYAKSLPIVRAGMLAAAAGAKVWAAAQFILNAAMSANPLVLLAVAIAAVVAVIILAWKNSETFRKVVIAAWDAIKAAAAVVAGAVMTALRAIRDAFAAAWSGVATVVLTAVAIVRTIITTYINIWLTIIRTGLAIILGVWRAVWGLFGGLITAVFNLIRALVLLYITIIVEIIKTYLLFLKVFWTTVWNALAAVISVVWGAIKAAVSAAVGAVVSRVTTAWNTLRAITSAVWNAVRGVISGVWSAISGVVSGAVGRVVSVVSGAWNTVRSATSAAWGQISRAVSEGVGKVVGFVAGLGAKVLSAVAGFGSLLFHAGAALIQGLIDGLTSRIQALTSKVSEIAGKVKDFFPGSPVRRGPLVAWNNGGAGRRLVGMLADGLTNTTAVDRAVRNLAGRIASAGPVPVAVTAGGAGGAGIAFNGPVYVTDPDELARTITRRQADANALYQLAAVAAVG